MVKVIDMLGNVYMRDDGKIIKDKDLHKEVLTIAEKQVVEVEEWKNFDLQFMESRIKYFKACNEELKTKLERINKDFNLIMESNKRILAEKQKAEKALFSQQNKFHIDYTKLLFDKNELEEENKKLKQQFINKAKPKVAVKVIEGITYYRVKE